MKACKQFQKLLSAYVDGELPPNQRKQVQEELERCEDCRAEYQELLRMKALVWEVSQEEQRAMGERSVWDGVQAAIQADAGAKARSDWSLRAWIERYRMGLASPAAPAGLATALVALIVAALLMVMADNAPGDRPVKRLALPEETAPAAEAVAERTADAQTESNLARANHPRRAPEAEKSFRRNECYVDSTNVEEGIVIVDIDPEEDIPAIVWHFQDEEPETDPNEDGAI